MEKKNLTQQKHTFTNRKKCTTTQNKHKKTKARFSHLLQHPAWKLKGSILVLALHTFVTHWVTYLDTYPPTYSPAPDPHGAYVLCQTSETDSDGSEIWQNMCLQCSDAVRWAVGRACGL